MAEPNDADKAAQEAAVLEKDKAVEQAKQDKAERERLTAEAKTLVKIEKGGDKLAVHPTCVDDHIRLGWRPA